MSTVRRVAAFSLFLSALAACDRITPDARAKLFPPAPDLIVSQERWPSATLIVIFWPDVASCLPCDLPALRALANISAENRDTQLLLVLPAGAADPARKLGVHWPGTIVRLEHRAYKQQLVLTPLPRVEVWDRAGRLLLLKAIPPNLVQAEALGEEIHWARARASHKEK